MNAFSKIVFLCFAICVIANGTDVNAENQGGKTKLHQASFDGDIEKIKSLIKKGVDVNCKGESGDTALIAAAGQGHIDIVKLLIDKGADVNAKGQFGYTPLLKAVDHSQMVVDPIQCEIAEYLIAKRADVNAKEERDGGLTALFYAAAKGNKELVKLLLANGADINAKGDKDNTALHMVAFLGHRDIAELLIAKGANVNDKGGFRGRSALHIAARKGHIDMVKLLIANGADVMAKDDKGQTPLDHAISKNHKEIAELLGKYGRENMTETNYHIFKLGLPYDKTIANVRKWALEQFADGPLDESDWAKIVVRQGLMEAEVDIDFDGKKELFLRAYGQMVFTPVQGGYRYLGKLSTGYFKILPLNKDGRPEILVHERSSGHFCYIKKYMNDGKRFTLVSSEGLSVGDGAPEVNNKKVDELFDNFEESVKFVKTPVEIFKKTVSSPSAKTIQTDSLPVPLDTRKNGDRNNISNETVVVEIDSKKTTYEDIRVPESALKQLKLREPNEILFRKIKKSIEYNNLKQKVEDLVLPAAIKQHKIIVSDKERDIRVAEQLEIVYGTKVFTEEDAEKQNELRNSIINLLGTWHNDNERGEALYREKFSKEIEQDDWEIFKKQYATKEDLDELKHKWPVATVEKVYSVFREAAVKALSKKKLVDKLRKIGELGGKETYNDWLDKKLASAKFLRKDIIRYEEVKKAETSLQQGFDAIAE